LRNEQMPYCMTRLSHWSWQPNQHVRRYQSEEHQMYL
jgi:hypothetical protein